MYTLLTMSRDIHFEIFQQPDATTCGPTCLHAIYRYYHDEIRLDDIISQVRSLDGGGTLATMLGIHALRRGYRATIYTYNINVFDPTWFSKRADLIAKLQAQMAAKADNRGLITSSKSAIQFIQEGGTFKFKNPSTRMFHKYLNAGRLLIAGLSATYLYGSARDIQETNESDDVQGVPSGHFVVLCGIDKRERKVIVADPYADNHTGANNYKVRINHLQNSIMLGILTHDANILLIEPKEVIPSKRSSS